MISYQWWNFDVVNIPEALDIIGQDVKPVNVAVLDTGSPFSIDPAYSGSIFDTQWGWDMEDNDPLADDEEFTTWFISVMVLMLEVQSQC